MNTNNALKHGFVTVALVVVSMYSDVSRAAANAYPEFAERMQTYYAARADFETKLIATIYRVKQAFDGAPDANKIRSTAEEAVKAFDTVKKVAAVLSSFLEKNTSRLTSSSGVINKLRKDLAGTNSGTMSSLVAALQAFGDGVKEAEFTVYAVEGWSNSDTTVDSGDVIFVHTNGSWSASPSMQQTDRRGYACSNASAYLISQAAPLGALIYRVRGSQNPNGQALNDNGGGVADAKGRLEFMINDNDRRNNSGQLSLKVVVLNGDAVRKLNETLSNNRGADQ